MIQDNTIIAQAPARSSDQDPGLKQRRQVIAQRPQKPVEENDASDQSFDARFRDELRKSNQPTDLRSAVAGSDSAHSLETTPPPLTADSDLPDTQLDTGNPQQMLTIPQDPRESGVAGEADSGRLTQLHNADLSPFESQLQGSVGAHRTRQIPNQSAAALAAESSQATLTVDSKRMQGELSDANTNARQSQASPTNASASSLLSQFAIESASVSTNESMPESGMGPSTQPDLVDLSQPVYEVVREGVSAEPGSQSAGNLSNRTDSTTSVATEVGRAVSQRVSEVLIQEVSIAGKNEMRQITLHLHPAELGRLTLQVGWESDSIIARIVASEAATSELLNGDKSWLMDALEASGVELDSFDISHDNSGAKQSPTQNRDAANKLTASEAEAKSKRSDPNHSIEADGSMVNLIA